MQGTSLWPFLYRAIFKKKKKNAKKYLSETSFQTCLPHCFTFIPHFSEQELKLIKKKLILVHVKQYPKGTFLYSWGTSNDQSKFCFQRERITFKVITKRSLVKLPHTHHKSTNKLKGEWNYHAYHLC